MRDINAFVSKLVTKCFLEYKAIPGETVICYKMSTEYEDGDVRVIGRDSDLPQGYVPNLVRIPRGASDFHVRNLLFRTIDVLPVLKYGD